MVESKYIAAKLVVTYTSIQLLHQIYSMIVYYNPTCNSMPTLLTFTSSRKKLIHYCTISGNPASGIKSHS